MSLSFEADRAIHRLIAEYCFFLDQRRLADLGALFAAEGIWEAPHASAKGPTAIHALLEDMIPNPPARRHFTTNVVIDETDEGAGAESYYLVIRDLGNGPQVTVAGSYIDNFVETENGWKFSHRQLRPAIVGDLGLKPAGASSSQAAS